MENECCKKCWGYGDYGMCMIVRKDGNCLWEESIVMEENEMFEYGMNVEYMKFMVLLKEYEDYWSYGSKYLKCDNCGSVMVRMYFSVYDEVLESDLEFWGFLCGNCGNIVSF